MNPTRKRIGRPPISIADGTRAGVGFRVTSRLKAQIRAAADASGRSLSQEIEFRLEQSFRDEWVIEQIRCVLNEPQELDFRTMEDMP